MAFALDGARLIDATADRRQTAITIDGRRIAAVGRAEDATPRVDAAEMIVTPGFIDVHTHGGGGFNLHTADPDELAAYARWAPSTGTTAFLAGVVGVPGDIPAAQLQAATAAAGRGGPGAELLGIHMEGPYINGLRRGAHAPAWLRAPSLAEAERILAIAGGWLRLITVAPELPGADAMIRCLVAAGVCVSMGHTDAAYEQARAAIALGVTHVTHCFNAMRPLLHRAPGPLGALVEAPHARGELIADGVHVHPAAVRALIHALGPEHVVVVTDGLPAAGVPEPRFTFGGQPAHVAGGAARLADGSLCGSVLTMDQALRNVVRFAELPLPAAVGMLTLNPARSAGAAQRKGLLRPGYDADLLVFDQDLHLQVTICRGRVAYATEAWRARLGMVGV